MTDDLYQQEILEHYKNPHNFGEIENPDVTAGDTNASCGDSFTFFIKFDKDRQTIQDITFTGQGCAISTASSSLLTDHLKGKPVSEMQNLNQDFMQQLIGTDITSTRLKCIMLPAKALQKSK